MNRRWRWNYRGRTLTCGLLVISMVAVAVCGTGLIAAEEEAEEDVVKNSDSTAPTNLTLDTIVSTNPGDLTVKDSIPPGSKTTGSLTPETTDLTSRANRTASDSEATAAQAFNANSTLELSFSDAPGSTFKERTPQTEWTNVSQVHPATFALDSSADANTQQTSMPHEASETSNNKLSSHLSTDQPTQETKLPAPEAPKTSTDSDADSNTDSDTPLSTDHPTQETKLPAPESPKTSTDSDADSNTDSDTHLSTDHPTQETKLPAPEDPKTSTDSDADSNTDSDTPLSTDQTTQETKLLATESPKTSTDSDADSNTDSDTHLSTDQTTQETKLLATESPKTSTDSDADSNTDSDTHLSTDHPTQETKLPAPESPKTSTDSDADSNTDSDTPLSTDQPTQETKLPATNDLYTLTSGSEADRDADTSSGFSTKWTNGRTNGSTTPIDSNIDESIGTNPLAKVSTRRSAKRWTPVADVPTSIQASGSSDETPGLMSILTTSAPTIAASSPPTLAQTKTPQLAPWSPSPVQRNPTTTISPPAEPSLDDSSSSLAESLSPRSSPQLFDSPKTSSNSLKDAISSPSPVASIPRTETKPTTAASPSMSKRPSVVFLSSGSAATVSASLSESEPSDDIWSPQPMTRAPMQSSTRSKSSLAPPLSAKEIYEI